MNEILVSINCITYNHEKYIAEAIESFLMQKTNFNFEILIHDDASVDGTADIIREYQKKYPDIIKSILQNENQQSKGVKKISYIYNHMRAKGKYIAMCEGDDYWTDLYKLQKQVDYMENNPECSMCFHAAYMVNIDRKRINVIKPYNKDCVSKTEDIILGDGGFMATNSILYRKCVMDNAPKLFLNAPVGDYPLQILTSTRNYAYYINEFMSAYRVGVTGSWSSRIKLEKNIEEKVIDINKRIIDMLIDFNQYSNGRYSDAIKNKILNNEFRILRVEGNIKKLKMSKYKKNYDTLSRKEKLKIYIKYYLPNICKIGRCINRYIKERV